MICILEENVVHIRASILEELVGAGKDDQSDFTVTQNRQLICFLH